MAGYATVGARSDGLLPSSLYNSSRLLTVWQVPLMDRVEDLPGYSTAHDRTVQLDPMDRILFLAVLLQPS